LVALLSGNAQNNVIYFMAFNARFLQGMANDMAAQDRRLGVVESAAIGAADGRAGGGYNDGFAGHLR
jgi:hypothetical protein